MTDVLGWPLTEAVEELTREGFAVKTEETSSRKGTEGTDHRVIRVVISTSDEAVLLYSRFFTDSMF